MQLRLIMLARQSRTVKGLSFATSFAKDAVNKLRIPQDDSVSKDNEMFMELLNIGSYVWRKMFLHANKT